MVFGRLTVEAFAGRFLRGGQLQNVWSCRCGCGRETVVPSNSLRTGHTKSCGCLKLELFVEQARSHGLSARPEYHIWEGMVQRCTNPNASSYDRYGAKGIICCDRWRNSFETFWEDMGARPSPRHTLERLNGSRGYEPSNVIWATYAEQNRNTSRNRRYTINGVTLCLTDWARGCGIHFNTLRQRLKTGWPIERAISEPPGTSSSRYRLITHNGTTMHLADWSRTLGIDVETIASRLDRYGWSVEKALNTPARPVQPRSQEERSAYKREWAARRRKAQHTGQAA